MPKAYVFTRFGGPETEAFVDVDRPGPGPGQVLVAVRAAGVNPVDWKQRTGYRRAGEAATWLPAVFGNEVAGVVEEVGDGRRPGSPSGTRSSATRSPAATPSTRCCRSR